jgi:hypothetical protein
VAVLLLAILVCVPAGLALAAGVGRARRPARSPGGPAGLPAGVARRAASWRWAGVIGGLLAAGAAASSGALGRGLLLAAPVFGLCVLAGVVGGEITVQPPRGRTRIAGLVTRRIRDYLPPRLTIAVIAAATALLALLTVTTATGAADDLGRPGRTLVAQCSAALQQGAGPWPGSFYSLPLGAVVLTGLVIAGATLRLIVRRPRAGADLTTVGADDAMRRRAAETITGACGVLVGLPLAGVCLLSAGALLSPSCRPAWWTVAGWALLALLPALAGLLGWCATVLLSPARARPWRAAGPMTDNG